MVHACNPSTWEVEAGESEFKVIFTYVGSLRQAWGT